MSYKKDVLRNCKIRRKTLVSESVFTNVAGLKLIQNTGQFSRVIEIQKNQSKTQTRANTALQKHLIFTAKE